MKLLSLILALLALPLAAQQPDIIYFDGDILTGAHLRADDTTTNPARVTALAVLGGKIIAAGPDAVVLAQKGVATKLVDLHGAFAMPGFNDAHTHIASAGQQKLSVDLDNVASLSTMELQVRDYAMNLRPGQWVLGGGWDHTKWDSKVLPTRQDLDRVTGDHPAYLQRTDGHIAVVNTAALRAAGITNQTPDPKGGKIDRDAEGTATGIIREAPALALIEAKTPPPTAETRRKALELAMGDALAHGVTSVQDYSDWADFLVLEQMEKEGKLKLRVSEWLTFNDSLDTLKAESAHHDANDPLLHTGMLKGFMDGSLGSRTAAMEKPYSDDPNTSGLPRYEQEKLDRMTEERAAAGFQIGFHAIGDKANSMALAAFDDALRSEIVLPTCYHGSHVGRPDVTTPCAARALQKSRFRIEHAQVILPRDQDDTAWGTGTNFDRFAKLGIIASMQPSHLLTDMAWAGQRLGPERVKYAYAWKSFLDHGVTLAFGTDYPVESISPFRGLYSAVTRMNEAGTQTFQPQEKITIQQALYAYTQASAFAQFEEKRKGILASGYLADMVVLDRDITKATPQQILRTKVLRTVLGGETVYLAK